MKTPEGKVKEDVKQYLTSIGAYWFMPVQTGYGRTTLDFLVCVNGTFLAIETKAPGRKLTPRQQRTIDEIAAAGGLAMVLDGVGQIKPMFENWFPDVA